MTRRRALLLALAALPPTAGRAAQESKPPAGDAAAARTILARVNAHRRKAGLAEVTLDARLSAAAQGHSEWMAREKRLDHRGRGGSDPGQRIEQAGYRWRAYAENIARGQRTADEVTAGWMSSAGHRRNILNRDVTQIGVGVAGRYWTLVLAAPRNW